MTIRRAVASDLDGLAELRAELLRDTFTRPYPPVPWDERKRIFERALSEGLLFVAEDDGGLAGFALGELERPPVGGIVFLHVRRDARRQGVARGLTAELVAALEAAGAEWIHIEVENDNADARAVYERWGFRPCASLLLASTGELRRRL
jgi:ribosomal protein S18 acetylase RimI-like enzyme